MKRVVDGVEEKDVVTVPASYAHLLPSRHLLPRLSVMAGQPIGSVFLGDVMRNRLGPRQALELRYLEAPLFMFRVSGAGEGKGKALDLSCGHTLTCPLANPYRKICIESNAVRLRHSSCVSACETRL